MASQDEYLRVPMDSDGSSSSDDDDDLMTMLPFGDDGSEGDGASGDGSDNDEGRRSPAPRSAAFASLSRIHFTRASVSAMLEYTRTGALPLGWSRTRRWKFRQQMGRHAWRIVRKSRARWEPTPASAVAATPASAAAATPASAAATPASESATTPASEAATPASEAATPASEGATTPTADDTEDVLEVQTPDPSADARALLRPRLVWLEVVAEEDVDAALHALYTDPAQGSLRGAKALYERALQRYVGVKMRFVLRFLQHQETAQAVQPRQGFLVLQPNDATEVGHWQADLTDVGLPTVSDAKHMLVCVDAFSKYAWAAPLASKHASGIAGALERMFLAEGPPITLRTDGGSDMANADVAALCARYGVARKVCAPYNSQCNGGVERLHLTLKAALTKHTHEWLSTRGSVDWVALLPLILYAYVTAVHRTTRFTPFFLQRSRAARPLGAMALEWRDDAVAAGPALYEGGAACDADGGAADADAVDAADADTPVGAAAAAALPTPAAGAQDDAEYVISRVIATQYDPARRETRYWVRWQGYSANDDSWITADMSGETDKQFNAWIKRTHKTYPPVALPGAFHAPRGFAARDVPVSADDRAALRDAHAADARLAGGGGAVAELEDALMRACAAVSKLKR